MKIPRQILNEYTERLNNLSSASKAVAVRLLSEVTYSDIADLREKIIEILVPLADASSSDARAYAVRFYNDLRKASIGEEFDAALSDYNPEPTKGAVRAIIQRVVKGATLDDIVDQLAERLDFEIKRTAGNTVVELASKDPQCKRWARVPSGTETCGFCLMLASRGFVYTSAENAGESGHYHSNCDCRIVPGFESMSIDGYDPDTLYKQWKKSAHAEYMKQRESRPRNHTSTYKFEGSDDFPSFNDFSDVKKYLYESDSEEELEHRFSILGNIYGFGSSQMRSQSMKNTIRHTKKRI